jgi:hypothetical protein
MKETTIIEERNFIVTIARILGHRPPVESFPQMACVWHRNPGTGRLECHWASEGTR